jgi:hypothetical protein
MISMSTGAGGDHGIAKMWDRREISASCYYDRSYYLHPHPYRTGRVHTSCPSHAARRAPPRLASSQPALMTLAVVAADARYGQSAGLRRRLRDVRAAVASRWEAGVGAAVARFGAAVAHDRERDRASERADGASAR